MTNDELQSKVIAFLRFPLIVGVVIAHNADYFLPMHGVDMSFSDTPICYICCKLFSDVIARIPVRLFFFMSGFLFFLHTEFNKSVYLRKLKNRVWTLLIPYLFWNATTLIYSYIRSSEGVYDWEYCLSAFWASSASLADFPIAVHFWFVRDLMVVSVFTPILYWFLKRTKVYGLTVIGLLWLLGYSIPYFGSKGFSTTAFFFFMAGAWFSINGKNFLEEFGKTRYWIYPIYIVIALMDLCTIGGVYNPYIHNLGILTGIVCCFNIGAYLVGKRGIKPSVFLTSATFFVYAIHMTWIRGSSWKILTLFIRPEGDGKLTLLYFSNAILTVCISLLIYYVLKRFLPRFTALITGGR